VPTLPAPSADVRAEALARAEQLSVGLFPHQVEGVAFLLGRRRAILADDMGLGKTRQSIVALTEAAPTGPWLVVVPASVKRNWAREILTARPPTASTSSAPTRRRRRATTRGLSCTTTCSPSTPMRSRRPPS